MTSHKYLEGLSWLQAEIVDSLAVSVDELSAYQETRQADSLYRCQEQLYRVLGSLKMAGCKAGVQLVTEMLRTMEAMRARPAAVDEGCQVLAQAIDTLPRYLQRVQQGEEDHPAMLMLLLNDLRAVQGEPLFSETDAFQPDLSPVQGTFLPAAPQNPDEWRARGQKLCHFYQAGLIPLLKGEPQQGQIRQLAKVMEPAESLFLQSGREYLWRAAGGFFEALLSAGAPLGSGGRSLLRGLERELRLAAEQGASLRNEPVPEALLRNLLYYVALAGPGSPRRGVLWRLFQLDQALPVSLHVGAATAALDDDVVVALANNLGAEVASVKATLEEYLADDCINADDLREAQRVLHRMSDSLAIAGKPALQQLCLSVETLLGDVVATESEHPGRGLLDQLAVAIVDLETDLHNWATGARQRTAEGGVSSSSLTAGNARYQLLEEIAHEVESLKNALLDHLELGENSLPASFDDSLLHLSTVMYLAEMGRCASVVTGLRSLAGQELEGPALNAVADALTGVERYLENCRAGREQHDTSLDWAEQALARLDGSEPQADDRTARSESDTDGEAIDSAASDSELVSAAEGWDLPSEPPLEPAAIDSDSAPPLAEQEPELLLDFDERDFADQHELARADEQLGAEAPLDSSSLTSDDGGQAEPADELPGTLQESPADELSAPAEEPAAPPVAADSVVDEPVDEELRDVFVEEAREVLESLGETFPRWRADPADRGALADTRRGFHTLKGSGRMVGAQTIGEFAWSLENLLNRVMERRLDASGAVHQCVADAIELLPALIDGFAQSQPMDSAAVEALRDRADRLSRGEQAETAEVPPVPVESTVADEGGSSEDRELREIFIAEARIHLDVVRRFVAEQRRSAPLYTPPSATLQSALHTLKGSTHMAGIEPLSCLVTALERLSRDRLTMQVPVDEEAVALFEGGISAFDQALALMAGGHALSASDPDIETLIAGCDRCRTGSLPSSEADGRVEAESPNDRLLHALMEDGLDQLMSLEQLLQGWQVGAGIDSSRIELLATELVGAGAHAADIGCAPVVDLTEVFAGVCERLAEWSGAVPENWIAALQDARESLLNMCDALAAHQEIPVPSNELLVSLAAVGVAPRDAHQVGEELRGRLAAQELPDETDAEIVELFLAEADELLEAMEHAFHEWRARGAAREHPDTLKRALHTFKGGARMASLDVLADVSHELESEVESSERGVAAGDVAPIAIMLAYHDALMHGVDRVREHFRTLLATPAPVEAPREEAEVPAAEADTAVDEVPGWPSAEIIPFVGSQRGLDDTAVVTEQTNNTSQEAIRLAAPVLDMLVNLAGEASISRGQVEQHVNEFMFSLDEMEATIRRMHDQVRRLGIETDAQVTFRREQIEASAGQDGFDPLEMDRYSQLQQLSRSLLESGSDLQDLRDTLLDKARDAETLLLHQSRINTDLQENLMRTRMVPFSRMVPRLRRIVRQVAGTLGKQVTLHLESVEGELDRTILERIVPALEHMVRNAVDHGIEASEERVAAGKSPEGVLSVSLAREGGDVLIRLADDGRGLDVDAIRAKALAGGLLAENAVLSDHEIQQFIFASGFSTSREVTEVSGRGVGMDVVNSEVRQLGGSVSINSQPGAGTEFTLRLPFTLSINRALMIGVGEDSYALPLNTITGVTRIGVDELLHLYQNPEETFSYGGEAYQVRYLGSLLSPDIRPMLDTAVGRQLPVVLMRSEGRNYAVQVDGLDGSREIVVKTLGPQFSRVPGLSGATVLGDGRVVVILDLQALLREQVAMPMPAPLVALPESEQTAPQMPTVMVVDDSVTVRKVTSRFLEREGFNVVTAKDGIDAMRTLQDHTPDLMLLDIEMPRMDGFEVTRLVRSTQRLKHLPIVMITSRTGEKHRDHALAMGADNYLGKPYQEDVLLEVIRDLLARGRTGAASEQAG